MVKEGDYAPDFRLKAHDGGEASLSGLRGRWVVLYFFPKAFTPGCSAETDSFSRLWNEFSRINVVVLGISRDSVETLRRFADKYGVAFKLLSDSDGSVAKAYGVLRMSRLADRVTFIIGPDGRVAKVIKGVRPNEHPVKALEYVKQQLGVG